MAVWWPAGGPGHAVFYVGLLPDLRVFLSGTRFGEPGGPNYVTVDDRTLPVPDWCAAAFAAGEPVEPLLDWLLEHNPDRDWLHAAVASLPAEVPPCPAASPSPPRPPPT